MCVCVCCTAAGGNEQPEKDHLARRRNRETAGLPDVHSSEGAGPFESTNAVYFSCSAPLDSGRSGFDMVKQLSVPSVVDSDDTPGAICLR